MAGTTRTLALGLLLFGSGACALVFEMLFRHQAAIALGNDVWASSTVLAGLMAGMALGGGLAARFAHRLGRPLRLYAALELMVALLGLSAVTLFPALGVGLAPLSAALHELPLLQNLARLLLTFVWLGLPAVAMGATLPILIHALKLEPSRFGAVLGALYAANTLGAVAGVLGAELWLVPALGIGGSARAAAGVGIALCLVALLSARWLEGSKARTAAQAEASAPSPAVTGSNAARTRVITAAAIAGGCLLALEVVWLRFLALLLNDTPLAFSIVLSVVLVGIALGGAFGGALARASERAVAHASDFAYVAGALGVVGYYAYSSLIEGNLRADQDAMTVLLVSAPLVLPTSLASGTLYTVLGARLRLLTAGDAQAAGVLGLANTLGSALGAVLGGLVLLPMLGMERSMLLLFASYGVIGLLLSGVGAKSTRSAGTDVAALTAFALVIGCFPLGDVRDRFVTASARRWMQPEDRIVEVVEGRTATIVHVAHSFDGLPAFDQIATNAYSMTVNDFAARRYMKLFALLPAALHPSPKRALVVGYGLGNTAEALLTDPLLERLDVVDVEPALLDLTRRITRVLPGEPLDDPKTTVHIDDGRHFLLTAGARGQAWDLITGEPPPPIMAGVVHLYTREHFALMRSRLRPGGMATYWLPMMNLSAASGRAIVRAFCDAFADCSLWHGSARNFMLLGSRDAKERVGLDRFTHAWRDRRVRSELIELGLEVPAQLGATFIGDAPYLRALTAKDAPLTDDFPRRMHLPGTMEQRSELLWQWRDTTEARKRFASSPLIARLFPETLLRESQRQFENQRLLNDLLFPEKTPVRQTAVLSQVIERTPLRLPVWLLLGSDPDLQRAIASTKAPERRHLRHELAGRLAERDFTGALRVARAIEERELPLPGLLSYLEQAASAPAERSYP